MRAIIVGYDPGTTSALAIIDTKGKLISLKSKRGFKKSEILDIITKKGKPLIVAGDRRPLPKSVEKLASILGCKSYHPVKTLSTVDKERLANDFMRKIKNDHEKDALASALQALNEHSHIFKRTENLLSSLGLGEFYDRIVESVILGKVENITEGINRVLSELRKKSEVPEIKKKKVTKKSLEETISRLQKKVKRLEKDVEIMKDYNEGLKKKLKEGEKEVNDYKKRLDERLDLGSLGKSRDELRKRLNDAKSLIQKLKSFRKLELEGYVPIVELNSVRDALAKDLDEMIGLGDRVVMVENPDNAQILNDYMIKALITTKNPSIKILEKVKFPIIIKKDISVEKKKDILVVEEKEFEKEMKNARKKGFIEWLHGHKKRRL